MQTTEALKRKIDTADDLATVVRTMKTLAAVNIRQYEAAAESLHAYQETIRTAAKMVLWNDPTLWDHQSRPDSPRSGLIVFGSDQGMCGGFNDAIATFTRHLLTRTTGEASDVPVIVLGRRLADRLADQGHRIDATLDLPGAATGIAFMLQELLPKIDQWRETHRLDEVAVCHNRRLSQTQYEPVRRTLLPVSPKELAGERMRRWPGRSLPMITMSSRRLWQSIVRQHLFVLLFQACAESQASENAARIASMQAAETHIRDRLDELNHQYQQLRQTAITEELLDVMTGYEALTIT